MNISNRLISTAARQRAAALLKELSLEEKVRQLGCTMLVSEDTDLTAKDLSGGIGEIALLDICEEPEALAARLRDVQQYVMEHSPHRIPALFHCITSILYSARVGGYTHGKHRTPDVMFCRM